MVDAANLVIKKKYNLSKRQLFEAWSNAQIMQRWFFGAQLRENCCTVENQFVTRGKYKVVMHFEDQSESEMYGEYLEINRYNKIVFTWSNSLVTDTIVTLTFKELSTNTSELTLEHSLLPDEYTKSRHNEGWDRCLENLAIALEAAA